MLLISLQTTRTFLKAHLEIKHKLRSQLLVSRNQPKPTRLTKRLQAKAMTMEPLIQMQRVSRTQSRLQMASRKQRMELRKELGQMLEAIQEKTLETVPSLETQRMDSQERLLVRMLPKQTPPKRTIKQLQMALLIKSLLQQNSNKIKPTLEPTPQSHSVYQEAKTPHFQELAASINSTMAPRTKSRSSRRICWPMWIRSSRDRMA